MVLYKAMKQHNEQHNEKETMKNRQNDLETCERKNE